jgi:hypothetical protein
MRVGLSSGIVDAQTVLVGFQRMEDNLQEELL